MPHGTSPAALTTFTTGRSLFRSSLLIGSGATQRLEQILPPGFRMTAVGFAEPSIGIRLILGVQPVIRSTIPTSVMFLLPMWRSLAPTLTMKSPAGLMRGSGRTLGRHKRPSKRLNSKSWLTTRRKPGSPASQKPSAGSPMPTATTYYSSTAFTVIATATPAYLPTRVCTARLPILRLMARGTSRKHVQSTSMPSTCMSSPHRQRLRTSPWLRCRFRCSKTSRIRISPIPLVRWVPQACCLTTRT